MAKIHINTIDSGLSISYYNVGYSLEIKNLIPCDTQNPVAIRNRVAHEHNNPTVTVQFYDDKRQYLGSVWTMAEYEAEMRKMHYEQD